MGVRRKSLISIVIDRCWVNSVSDNATHAVGKLRVIYVANI